MKPRILAVLLANLFAVTAASAQEAPLFTGSVSIGGIGSNVDSKDEAKANEYRDLNSGGILNFDLRGRGGRQWIDAFGENVGRDDQFIDVNGGVYGVFKGRFYVNDILHNHAWDARTPFSGVGGPALFAPITGTGNAMTFNTNPDTWNTYDARIKRRNTGGFAEVSPGGDPFYVRVDANQSRWSGVRILGMANGTSPGNGFIDMPTPTDYVVRTASLEAGYSTRDMHLSATVTRSKFTNENDLLTYNNAYFGGALDTVVLPQDNEQTKYAFNGVFKRLPLNSTLGARFTYAKTENSVPLLSGILLTANQPTLTPTPATESTYNGEMVHKTGSLVLNSQLSKEFDSKLYYNQYKKENGANQIHFTAQNIEPEIFGYEKKNLGVELGFRAPYQTRFIVGYDYVDLDRERPDFNNTKDKKLYLEVKSGAWDIASIRARLQRMKRDSNFLEGDAGVGPNDPLYLQRFVKKFDAANVDQDLFKLTLDLAPAPLLEIGLEYIYKDNDYRDTLLGRNKDRRSEVYAMISYGDPNAWRVTAFFDAEDIKYDSTHRNISTVAGGPTPPAGFCTLANPNCFDPVNGPSNTGSYNWTGKVKERNYQAGIGADVVFDPRFKFNASYTYQKTEGSADLTSPVFPAPFIPLQSVPVSSIDNVKIHTLNLKGTYKVSPRVDVTGGYAYEKYDYSDSAYDAYAYTVAGGNASQRSYLSGLYAFTNYKANIIYAYLTYRF